MIYWLDNMDDLADWCIYQANLHCLVHNTDTTINDNEQVSDRLKNITPTATTSYDALCHCFVWLPTNVIKRTFGTIGLTQYARLPFNTVLRKCYKSPNPALNVMQQNEPVAMDTIHLDTPAIDSGDTPAIDSGETYAQIFVGTRKLVTDVNGMTSSTQFLGTLSNNIIDHGAPTKLISDQAQVEISKHVQEILQTLYIASWQSEPHHQHQNPVEYHYQDVKQMDNTVLDHTSAPAYCWLLCLIYVCFVLNNCYSDNIKGVPLHLGTGTTNDMSPLLCFKFYEPVYYHMDDMPFPSICKECHGYWVGVSENVGNFMTFKVLTNDTLKIIHHSNIC